MDNNIPYIDYKFRIIIFTNFYSGKSEILRRIKGKPLPDPFDPIIGVGYVQKIIQIN